MNTEAANVPLMEVKDLQTWFPIKRGVLSRTVGHVRAVDGVSLSIGRGETVGLVGESGCGKTTLGRTLLRLEKATGGEISFKGRSLTGLSAKKIRPLRRQMQMVFQDPMSSLNPRMNVLDIITEGLVQYGLLEGPREETAEVLLREVGLGADDMFRYPHEFSGGQRQRISIARALSLKPEFLVCDEPVSALDVSVQAQVVNLLMDLRERYGLAYLFISHDLSVVSHISRRVAVMYLGRLAEQGPTETVVRNPMHPYTRALIAAVPVPGVSREDRRPLEGAPPSPSAPPPGCRFHPRCPEVMPVCGREEPEMVEREGHRVWCHLYTHRRP